MLCFHLVSWFIIEKDDGSGLIVSLMITEENLHSTYCLMSIKKTIRFHEWFFFIECFSFRF
jgi:hypothetical protein